MKESVLMRALEALWRHAQTLVQWQNLDAALAALSLMVLLRFTIYHRLCHEVFEFSGARLSMCGLINKSFCYLFLACAGFLVFQILRGRLL